MYHHRGNKGVRTLFWFFKSKADFIENVQCFLCAYLILQESKSVRKYKKNIYTKIQEV